LGRCPIYTVEFQRGGKATYHGHQFTQFLGSYEARVDTLVFQRLGQELIKLGLFTLPNDLGAWPDLPTASIEVRYHGDTTITRRFWGQTTRRRLSGKSLPDPALAILYASCRKIDSVVAFLQWRYASDD
jgi:hypothetical protein